MTVRFSDQELATILAALRHWQHDLAANSEQIPIAQHHFDDKLMPLTVEEIDALASVSTAHNR